MLKWKHHVGIFSFCSDISYCSKPSDWVQTRTSSLSSKEAQAHSILFSTHDFSLTMWLPLAFALCHCLASLCFVFLPAFWVYITNRSDKCSPWGTKRNGKDNANLTKPACAVRKYGEIRPLRASVKTYLSSIFHYVHGVLEEVRRLLRSLVI